MEMRAIAVLAALTGLCVSLATAQDVKPWPVQRDTGYRGIWYFNQETKNEYVYKYSGGLGTYCVDHIPMAVYAPKADKTFFVYGGSPADKNTLLEMVSFYDHATGEFPRPVILMDKKTTDAHDNPVLSIDQDGRIWVFASAHGTSRPAYIFRSVKPYDISEWELTLETNFSYPQPWYIEGKGFLFLHTRYAPGRGLNWQTSTDGLTWSEPKQLAYIEEGDYQISWPWKDKVGTAFNHHPHAFQGNPKQKGLNWRTNLYYVESRDFGTTWQTASGEIVATPITSPQTPALVHDYAAEGKLVYCCDLNYDASGNPIILYELSTTFMPGPEGGPKEWLTARWTGTEWKILPVTTSDHNYDVGSMYVERDGLWRIIAPTEPGPQPYGVGGEVALWLSSDQGQTWKKERLITENSTLNNSYCRRPLNAKPDFYAFWADGDARKQSPSHLYFTTKEGQAFRMPAEMTGETAKATPIQ
ncbi:MAG: BNR repeat-containing protein [Candidatus Hydrogenedentes bacterium]|nr:BNR repeat-containing protein [Candidatus Hydrogenedentota bacterium]